VSGISELKFEVPKVPKIWISANQEIRVQRRKASCGVTSYQGISPQSLGLLTEDTLRWKNEPDVLIT